MSDSVNVIYVINAINAISYVYKNYCTLSRKSVLFDRSAYFIVRHIANNLVVLVRQIGNNLADTRVFLKTLFVEFSQGEPGNHVSSY